MTRKGNWLFWTDAANAAIGLGLVTTGVIMRWVLPPGSGGGMGGGRRWGRGGEAVQTLLGMTRHDWGGVHFWLAVAIVAGVTLHLALHYGWIKACMRRRAPEQTAAGAMLRAHSGPRESISPASPTNDQLCLDVLC